MRKSLFLWAALSALAPEARAQAPTIDHAPVACAAAGKFPRLEARLAPSDQVASARVLFQGKTSDWYAVTMKLEGPVFVGVLPQPRKDLKSFRYYIDVTDKALGTSRTAEFTTSVVESASTCKGKLMAGALSSASVILQGPAGVVALPAGFASTGVIAAGTAAGSGTAVGAAGAGAGAGGGGVGATALVVGGLAVAAGAVAVGGAKGGSDSSSDSSPTGPGSTNPGQSGAVYNIVFQPTPPGIDMSACAGRPLTWSSQALSGVDANGNFNMTWAPNEPNTARISGQLTATSFQATLACVNGAQSGSISATGSGSSYSGSWTFGSQRGQASITKQ
jgi:hypothetical protein